MVRAEDRAAPGEDRLVALLGDLVRGLPIGERLPNERELSERFGASRTAIRDRLGMLQGLGIVRRQSGSGTYVDKFNPATISTALDFGIASAQIPIEQLESVRIALEQQAAREASSNPDPVMLGYMERALNELDNATSMEEHLAADRDFHRALIRASDNIALSFFSDVLDGVLRSDLQARITAIYSSPNQMRQQFHALHADILESIRSRDANRATSAVLAHFDGVHIAGERV